MIYSLLRGIAGVALRWYYADVTIVTDPLSVASSDRRAISQGPLLVVVNHPNALVDVLVAGRAVQRRLLFTAKATLFSNPVSRVLLTWIGVIPLRRASDEGVAQSDPSRNAQAFDLVTRALARGGAVLVFPEGKSHDEPAMAPLRTGVARIALSARDSGTVKGLRILPVGLVFQRKEALRSRVLATVGDTLDVDAWAPTAPDTAVAELTAEVDARLRAVTLNYESTEVAESERRIALLIAGLLRLEAPSIAVAGSLREQANIARLLPAIRDAARHQPSELATRIAAFEHALSAFQDSLKTHRVSLDDLVISVRITEGAVFLARETSILLAAGPFALWGWVNHVLPFHAAVAVGRRRRQTAADPAMRTVVAGAAFVLMVYMLQGAAVALVFGPWWALAYVASLPITADVNLRLRDRLARAIRRGRTYLLFRNQPETRRQLEQEANELRSEALAIAQQAGVAGTA